MLPALPCLLQQVLMLGARHAFFWEQQSSPSQMKIWGTLVFLMIQCHFLNTFWWCLKMFWASSFSQCFCQLCEVAGRSYALQIQVLNSAIYESQQHDNFRRRSTNDSKHRQHHVFAIYLLHHSMLKLYSQFQFSMCIPSVSSLSNILKSQEFWCILFLKKNKIWSLRFCQAYNTERCWELVGWYAQHSSLHGQWPGRSWQLLWSLSPSHGTRCSPAVLTCRFS